MRCKLSTNWKILITLVSIGLMITSLAFSAEKSRIKGMIDIDHPDIGEAKVEVNLAGPLFNLAAKAAQKDNPDASEFLASLKAVKVRIYDEVALGDKTPIEVLDFYKEQLEKQKWELLARVREEKSDVNVYALVEEDMVSGLVVLAVNIKDAVIVNLAGEIDLTKLAQIDEITGGVLGIPEEIEIKALSPKQRKKAKEQKGEALKSLFDGNPGKAIAILTELESEGITSRVDHALLAMLYHSTGVLDKAYYHLGTLYELGGYNEISTALYKKAVEINPQSAAAEKLSKMR